MTDERQAEAAELIQRIYGGDGSAEGDLYTAISPSIRKAVHRDLGVKDAEDRTHDIFMVILREVRGGRVKQPDRFSGFCNTIISRRIAFYVKGVIKERRVFPPSGGVHHENASLATGPARLFKCHISRAGGDPEQMAMRHQAELIAARALRALPDRDRELIFRFYFHAEPKESICASIGLSETQFRLQKSRAWERFRSRIRTIEEFSPNPRPRHNK